MIDEFRGIKCTTTGTHKVPCHIRKGDTVTLPDGRWFTATHNGTFLLTPEVIQDYADAGSIHPPLTDNAPRKLFDEMDPAYWDDVEETCEVARALFINMLTIELPMRRLQQSVPSDNSQTAHSCFLAAAEFINRQRKYKESALAMHLERETEKGKNHVNEGL